MRDKVLSTILIVAAVAAICAAADRPVPTAASTHTNLTATAADDMPAAARDRS